MSNQDEKRASEQESSAMEPNAYTDEHVTSDERVTLEEALTFEPEKKSRVGAVVRKVFLWGTLLSVAAGIGYVVYTLFFKPKAPSEFMTDFARISTIENRVQGSGTVTEQDRQDVQGQARGKVLEVLVAVGDYVEPDQLLLIVDEEEIANDLSERRNALTQAQKNIELVQEEIEGQHLRALFAGKTLNVKVEKGDIVARGQVLATLADDSRMRLVAYYSTVYRDAVAVGQAARISIPRSMAEVYGTVDKIENISKITDEGAVLFEVEIILDNPGTLTKGMVATALIETEIGLVAPAEAAVLSYNREENIKAKTSGEVLSLLMRDYYTFNEGEIVLTMLNDDLERRLSDELKALETARRNLQMVEEQYQYYSPKAEFAGQVLAVTVSPGDMLRGGSETIVVVADTSKMVMNINVDEMYVSQLVVGMPVIITAYYDTMMTFEGVLTSVAMQAEVGAGMSTFPARIEILGAEGLMSGMWLEYNITTSRIENVLVVPSNAIKYVEGGVVCFVRNVGNHHSIAELDEYTESQVPSGFTAVWVTTGASDAFQVEVTAGLIEMDEVATTAIIDNPYGRW